MFTNVDQLLPGTIEERPMLRMKQTIEAKPTIRVALTPLPPLRRVALTPLPPRRRVALRPLPGMQSVVEALKAENAQLEARNAYLMDLIAQNNDNIAALNEEIGMFMVFLSHARLQWRVVHH